MIPVRIPRLAVPKSPSRSPSWVARLARSTVHTHLTLLPSLLQLGPAPRGSPFFSAVDRPVPEVCPEAYDTRDGKIGTHCVGVSGCGCSPLLRDVRFPFLGRPWCRPLVPVFRRSCRARFRPAPCLIAFFRPVSDVFPFREREEWGLRCCPVDLVHMELGVEDACFRLLRRPTFFPDPVRAIFYASLLPLFGPICYKRHIRHQTDRANPPSSA